MADASYDVVVVGGGSKSSIASMYLTKYGGMSVGIFEERHELAAGWTSEEGPAPGFLANCCAHNMSAVDHYFGPIYEDFPEWIEYGVRPRVAPLGSAVCFPDGTWCGVYSEEYDPTQEKTAKLFARFSEKDAETWLWLYDKLTRYFRPAVWEYNFSLPPPEGVPDALERVRANPESGFDPRWLQMSLFQVLRDLFESEEIQLVFARLLLSLGVMLHAYGGGAALNVMMEILNTGTFAGGTHALAHATHRVIFENGGKIFTRSPVQKIIIENGTAKGIRLEDGTVVEAKKAVLSGVDPHQLCLELVGEEHFSPKLIRRIKNLERDWTVIAWYTWALQERPRYIAEEFDPDIANSRWIAFATSKETGMKDLLDEAYRRSQGLWPDMEKPQMWVSDHSSYVPGIAPPGKACILSEQWVLPARYYSGQEWKELEKSIADAFIRQWQKFAPNMTWDNVIGYLPVTPYYTANHARNFGPQHGNYGVIDSTPPQMGRNRPLLELSSGKMPISNLYATGAAWHPNHGAAGWQGYNIYKLMSQDFGLRKPWEEKGRPY